MEIEGRPLALLVNPSSGERADGQLLPTVEQALDERRIAFRVERTTSAEHAVERGPPRRRGRRGAGGDERRRPDRDRRRRTGRDRRRRSGSSPAAAATTSRGCSASPATRTGRSRCWPRGTPAEIDVGEANGQRFLGIASVGFDSDANRIANETKFVRGNLVYAYAAIRALVGWKPARFTVARRRGAGALHRLRVAVANNKAYGGGMFVAPDAELDDGEFDIVMVGDVGKLRFVHSILPKVFKGTHVEAGRGQGLSGAVPGAERQPPLRRLRRRRAPHRSPGVAAAPAAGAGDTRASGGGVTALDTAPRHRRAPLLEAKIALSRAARGRQPRQRPRRRHDAAGAGAAAPGAGCDRPPRRPPRGRHDRGQRHQRQDDHRRNDRLDPRRRRAPAGPQPRRLQHDLGGRHRAARAGRPRGAVRGRRGVAAAGRRAAAARR